MSSKSNDQGRAFEYACIEALGLEISKYRSVHIEQNSSFYAAKNAWNSMTTSFQKLLNTAAFSAVNTIFDLEPLILEDGNDELTLKIQTDHEGVVGDVRDILIIRRGIHWEVGLSVKHNHLAVKHSRLSSHLDFGESWYGINCSADYWNAVRPVFDYLEIEHRKGTEWKHIPNKMDVVYVPLLKAFMAEVNRCTQLDKDTPRKMVEYLLGKYDFYKVISMDSQSLTQVQTFNLRGTLNKAGVSTKPKRSIPISSLPTRIAHIGFVPGSKNTVEIYMDGGWQFSFRLHNAATHVEPSLKFDVQIVGMPATIISINCRWR